MQLRLDNIQGNITPGFRSDHQAFMFVWLPQGQAARDWLGQLKPRIASAQEIATFLAERRRPDAAPPATGVTWVNVAFSSAGLERLGADSMSLFPDDFRDGLVNRADHTGDDPIQMLEWEVGGTRANEAHAVILMGARTAEDLDGEWQRQREALEAHGGEQMRTYRGQRLPGALRDHEHFGFRDGVSQPDPPDPLGGWEATSQTAAAGEFLLGYPDEQNSQSAAEPGWAGDGSYLVFRRFRLDVFRFRRAIEREARKVPTTPEHLAAKLVGRWHSGAKLSDAATDPGWEPATAADTFGDFVNDPEGEVCPRFAHIRKAHPRNQVSDQPRRHRLIRRGIPYGPTLAADASEDDGEDRGLLFLAYQASLARQFEHVYKNWFMNADFPREGDGLDPLLAEPADRHVVGLREKGGRVTPLSLERFVSVTAGGYFFAPSLSALARLADPTVSFEEEERDMPYDAAARDLGEFILEQNPYSSDGKLPVGFQAACESDEVDRTWRFRDEDRQVRRAIRIAYTYRDEKGVHTDHLLIGYEGGSGN